MDDLGDGVGKEEFGGGEGFGGDHGDGVDDGDGVEKGLGENFPDGGDVAKADVDGAEEEGETEREKVEFDEKNRYEEPRKTGGDATEEGEKEDDGDVDEEVDNGGGGGGDDDDVFGEIDFAEEVAASDDGLDALIGAFEKEAPENGAGEEIDGVVRNVAAEMENFDEDGVEDGKHQKGADDCPEIAEDGALITEFEVGFSKFG